MPYIVKYILIHKNILISQIFNNFLKKNFLKEERKKLLKNCC